MTRDSVVCLIVFLVSQLVGITISLEELSECTSFCVCDTWYDLMRASCNGRHLYNIYTDAPSSVQALDLSDNIISSLHNFELRDLGLTNLKYLNLSTNAISEINLSAFVGLRDLKVLDLSKNRLESISDDLFEENKNLRILKLSRNNFKSYVPKLRVPSLMELSLDSCQINHLPSDTFNGLTHIRSLDLSNNLMIQMSYDVVHTLHFLKKLSLEGNPWSCNEMMKNLQLQLKHRNVDFDEVCGKKNRIQKFEKIILLPVLKTHNYYHHRTNVENGVSVEKNKSLTKHDKSDTLNNKNLSMCEQTPNQTIINSSNIYLPYQILLAGYMLGIGSGMFICYVWLSGKCSINWRCRRRQQPDDVSLLDWYYQNYMDNGTDRNVIECDLHSPPPRYSEVMLQPGLYRHPSISPNLNNNGTGRS
ncbi:leucine-rich repeat-containing protein 70-like [Ceratina calcarata]|uniref:Leucine-rich repeat-containing protein 70-like n=1 Tax=Ceratina calcarata TaxID=156304 RepID=A0AAJ7IZG8_9HYME|nr:leucine-rich repeat-containing protein 70-like [Ceratina calcarata]